VTIDSGPTKLCPNRTVGTVYRVGVEGLKPDIDQYLSELGLPTLLIDQVLIMSQAAEQATGAKHKRSQRQRQYQPWKRLNKRYLAELDKRSPTEVTNVGSSPVPLGISVYSAGY
jgi:hypothetical protein